jgi:hypothetical protein
VSSRLLRIEMLRAVTRAAPHQVSRANVVLSAIALLSIDDVAPAAELRQETAGFSARPRTARRGTRLTR